MMHPHTNKFVCPFVYFVYGMHHCCNIATERKGYPVVVLIPALEPLRESG